MWKKNIWDDSTTGLSEKMFSCACTCSGGGANRGAVNAHFGTDGLERLEHFPPGSQSSNALGFERCLIHDHHVLPVHSLEVGRVLVQPQRPQPTRHVVQQLRIDFVLILSVASAAARDCLAASGRSAAPTAPVVVTLQLIAA